ncbi:PilW family protein [Dechloromonas denitrificans]|uniref:PilW family protein n=1 Tax=Dechloromonas denitrificans TaxID=281362 RepID=UPI001CFBF5F3|nr:PilW family protein [Dechloromonas denitrificans]UCV06792.1 PilW family protein [Dechloromonas denitrificans]
MKTKTQNYMHRHSGFSLIEIMVGLAIGMLGIIVMMQVYALSEERKRTTTAGSDAQNNAIIALDAIQRDISRSGHGFANTRLMGCNLQLPSGATIPLAPVIVNPAATVIPVGDANTDTLLVSYGNADDQPDGYNVNNQSGSTYTITGTGMMKQNDRAIAAPAACGATTLVLGTVQSVTNSVIQLSSSEAGTALYNLGGTPRFLAYAIRSGNLTVCNYMINNCGDATAATLANQAIWRPIASNVVSLRAQYGRDTSGSMDGIVDSYDQTTPATACAWARASAIRFALVTRSGQFEKAAVTAAAPIWTGTGGAPIDLSVNTLPVQSEWQQYRYRVFETTAPIRNVAWMGAIAGC